MEAMQSNNANVPPPQYPPPPIGPDGMPIQCFTQPMEGITSPHHNDVLCGRGVTTNRHPGNENFRGFVNRNKALYVTSTKRQKMTISRSIVEAVRNLTPPGRFLEKDQATGLWSDIGDKKAVEKTSQALRDGAASLRKLLSDDLNDPDVIGAILDDPQASGVQTAADAAKLVAAAKKRKSEKKAAAANAAAAQDSAAVSTPVPSQSSRVAQPDTNVSSPVQQTSAAPSQQPCVVTPGTSTSPVHQSQSNSAEHAPSSSHHYPSYPPQESEPPQIQRHHSDTYHHSNSHNSSGEWGRNQSYNSAYSYRSHPPDHYYDRKHSFHRESSTPPRYRDVDISPPPSPRMDSHGGGHSSSRSNPWPHYTLSKDRTSSLFHELKHQSTGGRYSASGGHHYHSTHSSWSQQRDQRFPSPPHNRASPTNYIEVTQEGYYQCSSDSRRTVTGRFRGEEEGYRSSRHSSNHYDTPQYHDDYYSNHHHPQHQYDHHHRPQAMDSGQQSGQGIVTPSPTRKFVTSPHGAFSDSRKYFEPPRTRSSHHHHTPAPPPDYNDHNMMDHRQHHRSSSQGPHPNVATPSPVKKQVYAEPGPPPPADNPFEKDPFHHREPNDPNAFPRTRSFGDKSFDSKNSDMWLRESPLMFDVPMERTRSDGSSQSLKSDVTPLPYRSSPGAHNNNNFSPFLGFLCCAPSFCEQDQNTFDETQPWGQAGAAAASAATASGGAQRTS